MPIEAVETKERAHASFTLTGRKLELLNRAAEVRNQRVGSAARDLAVLYLESQQGSQQVLVELLNEVKALRAQVQKLTEHQ